MFLGACVCACTRVCGSLSVCVLSTLPSAESLPMPLWFYLLYDFLVNFIFFMCNSHQPHHANKGKRV